MGRIDDWECFQDQILHANVIETDERKYFEWITYENAVVETVIDSKEKNDRLGEATRGVSLDTLNTSARSSQHICRKGQSGKTFSEDDRTLTGRSEKCL